MPTVLHGDVLSELAAFPDCSFDACLCDPPYGISFMGSRWDYQVPDAALWSQVLRVLKPGAPLIAFSSTRTYHRAVVEVEDAGFEIRDQLAWFFATGFPKSLDISKALDAAAFSRWLDAHPAEATVYASSLATLADVESSDDARELALTRATAIERTSKCAREVVGHRPGLVGGGFGDTGHGLRSASDAVPITLPATELAKLWDGWGTSLKPGYEPAVLARRPLEGTVVENVEKWGVGGLAIDDCRIVSGESTKRDTGSDSMWGTTGRVMGGSDEGRWPANLLLGHTASCRQVGSVEVKPSGWSASGSKASENRAMSGANYERAAKPDAFAGTVAVFECHPSCPVRALDEQSGNRPSTLSGRADPSLTHVHPADPSRTRGSMFGNARAGGAVYADSGGASRFFFCPKASTEERELGTAHLPVRTASEMTGDREEGSAGLQSPRAGAGRTSGSTNHHPTVKPVELMRYLARLIMPPKPGKLLVPFAGSGSEMIGARLAGWRDITGIEWDAEFVEIARARVALADRNPRIFEKAIRAERKQNLRSLGARFNGHKIPRVLSK